MKKIGFMGCGNMGGAILLGALEAGVIQADDVYVYDVVPAICENMAKHGVHIVSGNQELCEKSDIILAAVKPQYTQPTLAQAGKALDGKCVISIIAGVTVERLRAMIDGDVRILRVMPNTPAMVFKGAFALCSDNDLKEDEKQAAEALFKALGIVEWIPEKLIDAVCGLSGGGPAWAAMFIEALTDGGVLSGLPRATAQRLAAQTVMGTAAMILEKGIHPAALKDMVTSPGGTTIEGCQVLENGGFRGMVMDCVEAATEKSKRL